MSTPANLSDLHFHVMSLTKGVEPKPIILVSVIGRDTEGDLSLWVDEYSVYHSGSNDNENTLNLIIQEALRAMVGRETPFLEALDAIRNEWCNEDGTWALPKDSGIKIYRR